LRQTLLLSTLKWWIPLEMAPVWLQQRQLVLDLLKAKESAERQMTIRRETATKIQQSLWAMLGAEASEGTAPELADCVRRARAQITLADQAQGQHDALDQQIRDGQSGLGILQGSVESAQTASDTWDRSWHAAVLAAGYETTVLADQVEAEIEAMLEVERLLARIRSIRSERIDTLQADLDGLAATAKRLAELTMPDFVSDSAEDITIELVKRLGQLVRLNWRSPRCSLGWSRQTKSWRQPEKDNFPHRQVWRL
jgi:hypothetical protein